MAALMTSFYSHFSTSTYPSFVSRSISIRQLSYRYLKGNRSRTSFRSAAATNNHQDRSLDGYDAVVIRSATKMTSELISSSPSLRLIGRAGVGVDNIDLNAATSAGIMVKINPF